MAIEASWCQGQASSPVHALACSCLLSTLLRPGTQVPTGPFNALLPGSAGETRVSPRDCWGRIATLLLILDCIDRLARDAIATLAGRMVVLHGRLCAGNC